MDEKQVRQIIRDELAYYGFGVGRFRVKDKLIVADGKNIFLGKTVGTMIGTEGGATGQKIGFLGATPVTERLKSAHNNWAAISDVTDALVELGLFDQS